MGTEKTTETQRETVEPAEVVVEPETKVTETETETETDNNK